MVSFLVGLHAALGEIGVIAFIWAFIEIINPNEKRIKRAKIATFLGTILFFLSWAVGGYYYVDQYGPQVKAIIKAGPQPWAHGVFMEVKEHVFIFLPFLSILGTMIIFRYEKEIQKDKKVRKSFLLVSIMIVAIGFLMLGLGYLVSAGARAGLGG